MVSASISLPTQASSYRGQATALIIAIIIGFAAFIPILRDAALVPLAIALIGLALITAAQAQKYVSVWLAMLGALGVAYATVSYFGGFERDGTYLFRQSAIFQQFAYTVALVLAVPAMAHFHERLNAGDRIYNHAELLILASALAAKALILLNYAEEGSAADSYSFGISQLLNPDVFIAFIVARRWIFSENLHWVVRFGLACALLLSASSSQAILVMIALLLIFLVPRFGRWIAAAIAIGFILVSVVAWPWAAQIWKVDPNIGIRLYFWKDVIERVIDSAGVGVGFGTETIRGFYSIGSREVVIRSDSVASFIHIGSHNAFLDALYRMGLAGLAILAVYFTRLCHVALSRSFDRNTAFDAWVVVLLTVTLCSNVALVSFSFFFGSAYLFGYLQSRAFADRNSRSALSIDEPELAEIDASPAENRRRLALRIRAE